MYYPDHDSYSALEEESNTLFDFHSFLSDDNTQMACAVDTHMNKIIEELKGENILLDGRRILGTTDGYAKQCKFSTALYFMSYISYKHGLVVDRATCCPGHGR